MSALDFSKLGKTSSKTDDLTKNKSFQRELPKEGLAFLRLIGYVETGKHKPNNPTHKNTFKVMLTFELSHKRHLIEIDGKMVPQKYVLRMNKGITAASGYKKVFNMMNKALGGGHTSFFEMMGKPLLGEIFHNEGKEDDKGNKPKYANLDQSGAFSFKSPLQEDPLSGDMVNVPVPELHNEMQGFMWENESFDDDVYKAMWDSLYIEGTKEIDDPKNKGSKIEVSKNWLQELIMSNIDWEGSTCQAITQEHVDLDDLAGDVSIDLADSAESDDPISM